MYNKDYESAIRRIELLKAQGNKQQEWRKLSINIVIQLLMEYIFAFDFKAPFSDEERLNSLIYPFGFEYKSGFPYYSFFNFYKYSRNSKAKETIIYFDEKNDLVNSKLKVNYSSYRLYCLIGTTITLLIPKEILSDIPKFKAAIEKEVVCAICTRKDKDWTEIYNGMFFKKLPMKEPDILHSYIQKGSFYE